MNIDRHNYEEFFILYLDNELSIEDRRQVDLFVQANPDLKEELSMLQQAQFSPTEDISFGNKESLFRSANCDINFSNQEEWLLLYIDNELTSQQRAIVESFVSAHPAVKAELDLLKKTKLHREEVIVFPDKESLYRKEETKRRVVAMRWWRIAAAAIILLAIGTASFFMFDSNEPGKGPSGIAYQGDPSVKSSSPVSKGTSDQSVSIADDQQKVNEVKNNEVAVGSTNDKTSTDKLNISTAKAVQQKNVPVKEARPVTNTSTDTKNNEVAVQSAGTIKNINNLPDPSSNPNMNGKIQGLTSIDRNTTNAGDLTTLNDNNTHFAVTSGIPSPLKDIEGNDEVDQPEKKNKLRGFFRTIARTIEKKTNIKATDDQDRLLIGGLAIKL